MDIKESTDGPSFEETGPVQLVSGESSGKSGGLLNLVPDSNMNENVDAPFGSYENRVITKGFPGEFL